MHFFTYLMREVENQSIPEPLYQQFYVYHQNYLDAATKNRTQQEAEALCLQWLKIIVDDLQNPFQFPPYHQKIRKPVDLFQFGIDFFSALIDEKNSQVRNAHRLDEIQEYLSQDHNVILLANHQTECDPQLLYYFLKKTHPALIDRMLFVAGDRVTSDPLARPFSMGCDLLCIYSKRHVNNPPELREEKLHHNQKSMKILKTLLNSGGKFIYVAPSGGRDRKQADTGLVYPADFDPDSIEMFRLLTKAADKPTHFYPLALKTYDILPPPQQIEDAIGEYRAIFYAPVAFNFGEEIVLHELCSSEELAGHDKKQQRVLRANKAFSYLTTLYEEI